MKDDMLKIKVKIMYFILYGCFACYFPFLSIYFGSRNFNYTQMGIVFAINSLIGVLFQPMWGYITDKFLYKKKALMIMMVGSTIAIFNFLFTRSLLFVIFCQILFVAFESPLAPVADAYSYEIIQSNKNIQYGRIRLMGSAGFAVMAAIAGIIIKITNIDSAFIIYAILMLGVIFITKSINFKGDGDISNKISFTDLGALFKNRRFMIFILSVFLFNIAQGANGNYIAVLIQKTGGDASNIGIMNFITAMTELPVLFFSVRLLKRFGTLNLYILSAVTFSIRYFLDSISSNYNIVLIIQILQCVTFTFYIISALQYVNEVIPPKMRTSGITLYTAIGCGLGGFIGNIIGGIIIDSSSIFVLYKILSSMCVVTIIISLILKKINNLYVKVNVDNKTLGI